MWLCAVSLLVFSKITSQINLASLGLIVRRALTKLVLKVSYSFGTADLEVLSAMRCSRFRQFSCHFCHQKIIFPRHIRLLGILATRGLVFLTLRNLTLRCGFPLLSLLFALFLAGVVVFLGVILWDSK